MATKARSQAKRGGPPMKGGRRTTVRLSGDMNAEVVTLASELGVSENEAHLHLLQVGVEEHRRRRRLKELIERRQALVWDLLGEYEEGDELPSADELEEAIMSPDDFEGSYPEDD